MADSIAQRHEGERRDDVDDDAKDTHRKDAVGIIDVYGGVLRESALEKRRESVNLQSPRSPITTLEATSIILQSVPVFHNDKRWG